MGTRFEVLFYGIDHALARSVFDEIRSEVNRLESELSHYNEKSPVTAIINNAGVKSVAIPATVLESLEVSHTHYQKTGGLFDITKRPSVLASGSGVPADFTRLKISKSNRTAYLKEPGMEIDLGGIGKGIALHRAEQIIDGHGIQHGLISFGESSILTRGHHPHGNWWEVGIEDMFEEATSRATFQMNDHALSTSGNTPNNEGHIHHPRTGEKVTDFQTVSVLHSSPIDAEVLSTALLVANRRETKKLLRTYNPDRAIQITYRQRNQKPNVTDLLKYYLI